MAGSQNYKLLLQAQIDPKSVTQQIEAISKTGKNVLTFKTALDKDGMKQFNAEMDRIRAKASSIGRITFSQDQFGNLNKAVVNYTDLAGNATKATVKLGEQLRVTETVTQKSAQAYSFMDSELGKSIQTTIRYATSVGLITAALSQLREGIQYVKELNKELTNIQVLQIEGAKTDQDIANLSMQYNDLAKSLGSTTIEVTRGSVEWLRQGKTIEETQDLLKNTMYLSKLGALDSAQATEYLTAILNGYNMKAEESARVVDKLVAIDNIAATSAGELATAMQYSSAVASQAGVSFDSLAAMIGAVSSNTRLSAEMIGTAFRTMMVRMTEVKAGAIDETGKQNMPEYMVTYILY